MLNICAAVLLCGCYNSTRLPAGDDADVAPNMTLAELRGLWRGATFEIAEPIVVGGVVTSSDKSGNFYQTLTIEDSSSAAEIRAGMRDLHNTYPVGCYVCIKLKGCAVGIERGVLQVGLMPESYSNYTVDYFYSKVMLDRYVVRSSDICEVEPTRVKCPDLRADMCGSLVRICGLQYTPETETDLENNPEAKTNFDPQNVQTEEIIPPATWAGYRAFADADGNRVYVYTSDYATFAGHEVPTVQCDITGILQYGTVQGVSGEWFMLKMRDENDCTASIDFAL